MWVETQLVILSPITPHFCDVMWTEVFLPSLSEEERKNRAELASQSAYPEIKRDEIDFKVVKKFGYLEKHGSSFRSTILKFKAKNKKKEIKKVYMVVRKDYKDF